MRTRRLVPALALTLTMSLTSILKSQVERRVAIPIGSELTEQNSAMFWIASPFAARHQLVFDAASLAGMVGTDLIGFEVRRDTGDNRGLDSFRSQIDCIVSTRPSSLIGLESTFANNHGVNRLAVLSRKVAFPAVPASPTQPAAWGTGASVRVMFTTPFRYDGGGLCLETKAVPDAPSSSAPPVWWPIDGRALDNGSVVQLVGSSCIGGFSQQPADVDPVGLAPGATSRWFVFGRPTRTIAIAVAFFGSRTTAIDLTGIGAPSCMAYVFGDFAIAAPFSEFAAGGHGLAECVLPIPLDGRLVGASLVSQWIVAQPGSNTLGLTLSNAVHAKLGASIGMDTAWIEAASPDAVTGKISYHRTPVVRLLFR
ncbi:MAG: hypothetical protein H6834_01185 [Planctomycetes bacterium]|nr:hypothetical protein [Planctomycetota bacterium]